MMIYILTLLLVRGYLYWPEGKTITPHISHSKNSTQWYNFVSQYGKKSISVIYYTDSDTAVI
jgi:hypothetical protein